MSIVDTPKMHVLWYAERVCWTACCYREAEGGGDKEGKDGKEDGEGRRTGDDGEEDEAEEEDDLELDDYEHAGMPARTISRESVLPHAICAHCAACSIIQRTRTEASVGAPLPSFQYSGSENAVSEVRACKGRILGLFLA